VHIRDYRQQAKTSKDLAKGLHLQRALGRIAVVMKKGTLFVLALLFWVSIPLSANAISVPIITEEERSLAISGLMDYNEGVREAVISQDGRKVKLAIIVDPEISEAYAKQLGENFVRLVKSFSKDRSPGSDIGAGIYDYLITVYYPDRKLIAAGQKEGVFQHITW
jgi:hypothetical protein